MDDGVVLWSFIFVLLSLPENKIDFFFFLIFPSPLLADFIQDIQAGKIAHLNSVLALSCVQPTRFESVPH